MFDKDIPIPDCDPTAKRGMGVRIENGRGRPSIYCFERMEIGDSYLFDGVTGNIRDSGPVRAMYRAQKKHGINLVVRRVDDGIRIWRIA